MKLLLYLFMVLACENKTRPPATPDPDNGAGDTLYIMDMFHPEATQSLSNIGPEPDKIKFVQVEVTRVVNPKKYPVTLTVHYRAPETEPVMLGLFSLFPADHPGVFIVSASGRLTSSGELILRLERPDDFMAGDTLEVETKEMRFVR